MFEKCDSTKRKTCKSDEEVKEWMKDKYFIIAYNKQIFNSQKFGDEKFSKYSTIDWHPMDIKNEIVNRYSI
jgi:hypothetical protein